MELKNNKHWVDINPTRRYRVDEVAKILNCSRSMVYKLLYMGELEWVQIGKVYRVPGWSIIDYLEANSSQY